MTTFGKRDSAPGAAGAKPTFGKKTAQPVPGRAAPPPQAERLSPQAMAFLEAERNRPPVAAAQQPVRQSAAAPMPSHRQPAPSQPASKPAAMPAEPQAAAPTRPYVEPRRPSHHAYAGKPVWGRRVAARLVDEIGVWVLIYVLFNDGFTAALSAYAGADPGSPQEVAASVDILGFALIFMVAQCAYNIAMESSSLQATLGKLMVGAVVTSRDGKKPTLGSVVLRNTIGRFAANAIPFCAGYIVGLFNPERRCVHDMIGGTVVRQRTAPQPSGGYGEVFA